MKADDIAALARHYSLRSLPEVLHGPADSIPAALSAFARSVPFMGETSLEMSEGAYSLPNSRDKGTHFSPFGQAKAGLCAFCAVFTPVYEVSYNEKSPKSRHSGVPFPPFPAFAKL